MSQHPQHFGPPFPGAPVAVTMMSTEVPVMPFGTQCPTCHEHIITEITRVNGLLVWLFVLGLCVFGCVLGCCLIPFCIDDFKDVEHRCPLCHTFIGARKRM